MDHIDPMFESDSDDIVLGEICTDGSQTLANLIRFIGLSSMLDRLHTLRLESCTTPFGGVQKADPRTSRSRRCAWPVHGLFGTL